jgi:hypothetical protein
MHNPVTPTRNTADAPPTPDTLRVVRTAEPSPANNRDTAMTTHDCTCCTQLAEMRANIRGIAAALVVAVEDHDPPTQES